MLKGKTAVITGGSRGIGKAIAIQMARNGANVAVIYAGRQEAAESVCEQAREYGVKAVSYQCDVADFEMAKKTCEQIISDFAGIDILVNNAGVTKDNLLLRMSEEDFDCVIDVNLKGTFNMIRQLARYIIKSRCGRVINISSVSGLMGNVGQSNYSAAKAGLIGLTKTVARELAGRQATCNAIAPGYIETDMTADLPQNVKDYAHNSIPLKRMGNADEIAGVAVFLASDAASYITGEVIRVDGGLCM